jgi:hypothetical protein
MTKENKVKLDYEKRRDCFLKNGSVIGSMKKSTDLTEKQGLQNSSVKLPQRYESAYLKILEEQDSWKKNAIVKNTGQKDRVVDEFCKQVVELAESDAELN